MPSCGGQRADRRDRVVQLRRGALDAGERADRDDVDGIVGRAVAVGAHVLGDEVCDEALDVDRARRHGDRELVGLARVAHVGVAGSRSPWRRPCAARSAVVSRLDLGERRLEGRSRDLVAAQHQRAHDLVLGVGEEQPEGAEDAGSRRDEHLRIASARAISTPVSGPLPPNAQSTKSRGSRPR